MRAGANAVVNDSGVPAYSPFRKLDQLDRAVDIALSVVVGDW